MYEPKKNRQSNRKQKHPAKRVDIVRIQLVKESSGISQKSFPEYGGRILPLVQSFLPPFAEFFTTTHKETRQYSGTSCSFII